MIRIDPARHLEIVVGIIQNKYLSVFVILSALGISMFGMLMALLLPLILYVFPLYLLFTLIINSKIKWAAALVTGMSLSFILAQIDINPEYLQSFLGYLPLLFLVIYCFLFNLKLNEWGYRQDRKKSPLWF